MRQPPRLQIRLLVTLLAILPAVQPLAQPVAETKPANDWLAPIVAVFLVVIIAVGSFMGSRRGHQD